MPRDDQTEVRALRELITRMHAKTAEAHVLIAQANRLLQTADALIQSSAQDHHVIAQAMSLSSAER